MEQVRFSILKTLSRRSVQIATRLFAVENIGRAQMCVNKKLAKYEYTLVMNIHW